MSLPRFIVLGAFLLSAACTASSADDADLESDSAEYRSTFRSIHSCMTDASAHKDAGLVEWASVGVASRDTKSFLFVSLHLNLTREETDGLRKSNPYTFTGGIGMESPLLLSATVGSKHYQSTDGTVSLDLDLNQPHALDHAVISPGRGSASVKVDFGTTKAAIPARVRALGVKTFQFTLNDCR